MRQARIVWVTEVLKRYLTSPQSVVHGNKMPFPGIPKPADRENVVAFLETLR
jgi:cytochrome c